MVLPTWTRPIGHTQTVFQRGSPATAARIQIGKGPSAEAGDRAHYLWGCFHLLWSLFIYGLGISSGMTMCRYGTWRRAAHTSSVIRSRMVCYRAIRDDFDTPPNPGLTTSSTVASLIENSAIVVPRDSKARMTGKQTPPMWLKITATAGAVNLVFHDPRRPWNLTLPPRNP